MQHEDGPAGFQRDITAATLIAVYVPFLAGFAALLAAAPDDGHLRILATLIHALKRHGKKRGLAALCICGGEATAVAVEVS